MIKEIRRGVLAIDVEVQTMRADPLSEYEDPPHYTPSPPNTSPSLD